MVNDFKVYEVVEDTFASHGYWPGDPVVQDLIEACVSYVVSGVGGSVSKYLEDRNVDGVPALGIVVTVEAYAKEHSLASPSAVIRRAIDAGCSVMEGDDYAD